MNISLKFISLFLFAAFMTSCAGEVTKVYLVRHAEKSADDSEDPGNPDLLDSAGLNRANDLKRYLEDAGIVAVYSTPYERTIQTGAPLRTHLGLDTLSYEPEDSDKLYKRIYANHRGKSVLVVGHSNTLSEVIRGFDGNPPLNLIPDDEFDHMYILVSQKKIRINGGAQRYKTDVLHMHYGAISAGAN